MLRRARIRQRLQWGRLVACAGLSAPHGGLGARRSLVHPPHNQNINFSANCTCRAGNAVVIVPNAASEMFESGVPKFV